MARATKAASRSQSAWWPGSSAMLRSSSGWPTRCRRIAEVLVWVSMSSERALSGMRIETAPLGRDHVLNEEGGVGHHRAPAGLVPAERAVGEEHLEVAVVVHARRDLVREPQAHAADLGRGGVGDLAHHVDVVYAAIDDRRGGLHQRLVRFPRRTRALLVQVQTEDEGAAERPGLGDQPLPGRVVAQDVADYHLAAGRLALGRDALGVGDGRRERLLDEDVGAGLHRRDGIVGVAVGVGRDRDQVGFQPGEPSAKSVVTG